MSPAEQSPVGHPPASPELSGFSPAKVVLKKAAKSNSFRSLADAPASFANFNLSATACRAPLSSDRPRSVLMASPAGIEAPVEYLLLPPESVVILGPVDLAETMSAPYEVNRATARR